MNDFLSKYFTTDIERIEYHLHLDKNFDSKTEFIIGLDGMICEKTMLKGQSDFGHLYSAISQVTGHWTENFRKTNDEFKKLWNNEEWTCLLEYEKTFISLYRKLTHWKHEPPKAPRLFELESYKELKVATTKLFDCLAR